MKKNYLLLLTFSLIVNYLSAHVPPGSSAGISRVTKTMLVGSPLQATTVAGGNGIGNGANQLLPNGIFVDPLGNLYASDAINNRVLKFTPGSLVGIIVAGGNGSGSGANQFFGPTGVFVDPIGNIYVGDKNNNRVQKWAPGALAGVTVAGGNGAGSAANQVSPSDIWVDGTGNLFVAENYRVQKWAPGALAGVTVAGDNTPGPAMNQLNVASGIFVDGTGNLFIADNINNRIMKWAPGAIAGVVVAGANGLGAGDNQLSHPVDVFVSAGGNIYISDEGNDRIQRWAPGALSGTTAGGGNGGGSAADQLNQPRSIFVSPSGTFFVADAANYRVQKFPKPDLLPDDITIAGGNGPGPGVNQLHEPNNVFVDKTGSLYVADLINNRIQKFAAGSVNATTVAGANGLGIGANQLAHPTDVRLDEDGNIYIADYLNHRVQKWGRGATTGVTVAGGNGQGSANNQLSFPAGIFVDKDKNIFVADYQNNRIQKWAPGASAGNTVAGGFGNGSAANQIVLPNDVFVDLKGNIFIADQNNHRIQKWAPGMSVGVTVAGGNGSGSGPGQLSFPTGVFVDKNDNIFIADFGNQRVQKWMPGASSGITIAGGNGRGSEYNQLDGPVNVAIDADNNLFISDANNDRIQKLKPTGLSYRFIQGSFTTLPNFNLFPSAKSGLSANVDLNIRPAGANDRFAIVWEGSINIPAPGIYTFETLSDDGSRLYFNSLYSSNALPTVDNDGLHAAKSSSGTVNIPKAGVYPITISYFENSGDEIMKIFWTGPGIPRQPIPDAAFSTDNLIDGIAPGTPTNLRIVSVDGTLVNLDWDNATESSDVVAYDIYVNGVKKYTSADSKLTADGLFPNTTYTFTVKARDLAGNTSAFSNAVTGTTSGAGNGLTYKYYEGSWNALPDFNTLTPVKTGRSPNIDLGARPAGRNDNFAFLWQGYVNIVVPGIYTFETVSDDGSRFYFNSLYVPAATATVNNDGLHAPLSARGTVNISVPGVYPIAITFFEKDGGEKMELYWSGPGIARQLVPDVAFVSPPLLTTVNSNTASIANAQAQAEQSNHKTVISKLYPDPFTDRFNVEFYNSGSNNNISVGINDLQGRLVYTRNAGRLNNGMNKIMISLGDAHLADGIYMVTLYVNGVAAKPVALMKRGK